MIELYTWITANCQKVNIAVCELDLEVEVKPVDISKKEQHSAEYLAINPNNKVPAIRDRDTGIRVIESGAILLYLAERTGRLVLSDDAGRWEVTQWIFWQMAGLGPAAAQLNYFGADEARGTHARDRFRAEMERLLGVLDRLLAGRAHVAGAEYSMADIAVWPWITRFDRLALGLAAHENVLRWYRQVADRPAVRRGFEMLQPGREAPMP